MKTRKKLLCMIMALVFSCAMICMTASASAEPVSDVDSAVTTGTAAESSLDVYLDSCPDCDGEGACYSCEDCGFTGICSTCAGTGEVDVREGASSGYFASFWALIPPIIAIGLALITKEVYSSLFVGIVVGGLLSANVFKEGFSLLKLWSHQ